MYIKFGSCQQFFPREPFDHRTTTDLPFRSAEEFGLFGILLSYTPAAFLKA
jgi:hypothetical protein